MALARPSSSSTSSTVAVALTPVTRLRALVARAFALGGRLRPQDVPLVVAACRSLRGSAFLETQPCRELVSSAVQRVLAADYAQPVRGAAAVDLTRVLWFVAAPTAGRVGALYDIFSPESSKVGNPYTADLKQLSLHCHTIVHEIVEFGKQREEERRSRSLSSAPASSSSPSSPQPDSSSSSSSSFTTTTNSSRRRGMFRRVSPYAFVPADISSWCSALQRAGNSAQQHKQTLQMPVESVLLFADAWAYLTTLPRRRMQESTPLLTRRETAETVVGAFRMLRGIDAATHSSAQPFDAVRLHDTVSRFSYAFTRRLTRVVRVPRGALQVAEFKRSTDGAGGKVRPKVKTLKLLPVHSVPMTLFEEEIVDVARALVRIYGPRLRATARGNLRFRDRLTVVQMITVIIRRSRTATFSSFSRGELATPLRQLTVLLRQTSRRAKGNGGGSSSSSSSVGNGGADERTLAQIAASMDKSGVNTVLRSLIGRYAADAISISWPRSGLLPLQAMTEETAVCAFLQTLRMEAFPFAVAAPLHKNETERRDAEADRIASAAASGGNSSNSSLVATRTAAQMLTHKLLFDNDALGVRAVVSHAVAFLRFCGERQHVRFHEFWGFGKKGRACLTALSRLLPPYAQHKAVALGTQDLIRHVFLPGLHRELNATPRSTSGAASSFGSGGGAGATTVVACTMTRANATLILGFSADMLTTIRFAAGSTTWVDQGLVGELIEMANNAAAASVGGPSAPACRSAADILLSLCALGVDMETEARGVLDLLQHADLQALAAPRELSKIVTALLRAPRSRSANDDDGADRRQHRRSPHGGKVQQLLRKVQEAQRQQRRNHHNHHQ